jgi:hypothetical protein
MKRCFAVAVRGQFASGLRRTIGRLWTLRDAPSGSSPESSPVPGAIESADRESSEQPGAVQGTVPVPEASIDPDPGGEVAQAGATTSDALVLRDSASEPSEKSQERRRKRRKSLPEPPIPIFIKVSPGRYVRAEPSSQATPRESGEEDLARETQDSTASLDISISPEESPLDPVLAPRPSPDTPEVADPAEVPA